MCAQKIKNTRIKTQRMEPQTYARAKEDAHQIFLQEASGSNQ